MNWLDRHRNPEECARLNAARVAREAARRKSAKWETLFLETCHVVLILVFAIGGFYLATIADRLKALGIPLF